MYSLSVRFAPLSVPLQRRLQTLIVLAHTLCIACFLTSFFLLAAVPLTWPLLLPYLLYIISPLQPPPLLLCLVLVCFILPSPSSSFRSFAANEKVCFWIPPAWHHISWCLRRLRYRSIGLFPALPRNHQYSLNTRCKLPSSFLSRLRPCHGFGLSIPRKL